MGYKNCIKLLEKVLNDELTNTDILDIEKEIENFYEKRDEVK